MVGHSVQAVLEVVCRENNIDLYGVCDFDLVKDSLKVCRALNRLPNNSKTVISFAFPYKVYISGEYNVSRYAIVKDYHVVIMNMLTRVLNELKEAFPTYQFEAFVDASPIPEVWAAALSGLGVIGDNGLLITQLYGSWVFLGEIVTDMETTHNKSEVKYCLHCGKCKQQCPVATTGEKKLKCASAVSQQKQNLSPEQENIIRKTNLVWGCDICQEVCPMNQNAQYTNIREFTDSAVCMVCAGDYDKMEHRAFHWRKKNVIERNIEIMKRQ